MSTIQVKTKISMKAFSYFGWFQSALVASFISFGCFIQVELFCSCIVIVIFKARLSYFGSHSQLLNHLIMPLREVWYLLSCYLCFWALNWWNFYHFLSFRLDHDWFFRYFHLLNLFVLIFGSFIQSVPVV